MGGDAHKVKTPPVPDWRIYKVEDIPELAQVQRALASHGLKDPWLRNEAWRYDKRYGTLGQRLRKGLFRGLPLGFALAVVTAGIEKLYFSDSEHKHDHH